jgi:alpha-ketoglutarate-dependent taurine dioxygenase
MEFFDLSIPNVGTSAIEAQVHKVGIAFFKNAPVNTDELLRFATHFGAVLKDGAGKEDGVSRIAYDPIRAQQIGGKAYSRQPLFPHTDRSAYAEPPRFVITVAVHIRGVGGSSTFVSGDVLFKRFAEQDPKGLESLMDRNNFVFRRSDTLLPAPIFEASDRVPFRIRFRWDEALYISPAAIPHASTFVQASRDAAWDVVLEERQGYILDNHRMLHGRRGFYGEREIWRVLVT